MKFQPGDIVYVGSGNGTYCTLAKVKIVSITGSPQNQYYEVEMLEDIFHIWGRNNRGQDEIFKVGRIENALENTTFENYADAEENVFIKMSSDKFSIRTWKQFIIFMFVYWHT